MKLLFLCSRNKKRSLTAEKIFEKSSRYTVRSAGTESSARIKVNQKLVDWADHILVMEKNHRARLYQKVPSSRNKKVYILDILDVYEYMDEDLILMLKNSVNEYIDRE